MGGFLSGASPFFCGAYAQNKISGNATMLKSIGAQIGNHGKNKFRRRLLLINTGGDILC